MIPTANIAVEAASINPSGMNFFHVLLSGHANDQVGHRHQVRK
jgi:hypothetical protein